jgi:hypothetical protein
MSHDAFISYSSRDKATADATCAALETSGVRCWIAPRDITPGIEWGEAIIDGINQSRVLVLIFSANANESPQIRREIERAVGKGIPIIPFRIQDIAPTRSLEYFIGAVHWLDALTPPLETHLRRLVDTVKALLQIDPTPPRIVSPSIASTSPVSWIGSNRRIVAVAALTCLALSAAVIGVWWSVAAMGPRPTGPLSVPTPAPTAPQLANPQLAKASVDPVLTGTSLTGTIRASSTPSSQTGLIAWISFRKRTAPTKPPTVHTAPSPTSRAAYVPGPTARSAPQP